LLLLLLLRLLQQIVPLRLERRCLAKRLLSVHGRENIQGRWMGGVIDGKRATEVNDGCLHWRVEGGLLS
jgi:hypothetical protein